MYSMNIVAPDGDLIQGKWYNSFNNTLSHTLSLSLSVKGKVITRRQDVQLFILLLLFAVFHISAIISVRLIIFSNTYT